MKKNCPCRCHRDFHPKRVDVCSNCGVLGGKHRPELRPRRLHNGMRKHRWGYEIYDEKDMLKRGFDKLCIKSVPLRDSIAYGGRAFAKHLWKPNGICRRCKKNRKAP